MLGLARASSSLGYSELVEQAICCLGAQELKDRALILQFRELPHPSDLLSRRSSLAQADIASGACPQKPSESSVCVSTSCKCLRW